MRPDKFTTRGLEVAARDWEPLRIVLLPVTLYYYYTANTCMHTPEPEFVEERAELACAKKAEPERGVDRGLSRAPFSDFLAGRFSCGTARSCSTKKKENQKHKSTPCVGAR